MRISLATRAACACAAATLIFSLCLAPSYARMGGSGGASFARRVGFGHFHHFGPRAFNQRFDFNRFGPQRFDRFGLNRFGRFGATRFNRFGYSRFGGNPLAIGGWGWGGWGWDGWDGVPVSAGTSEPVVVGTGAPVIINIGADPKPGDAASGYAGGCVIHKLIYDGDGEYVGERQSQHC